MNAGRLSERQRAILEFFEEFLDENGYPPTVRDIQHGCEISSTSVVAYNIEALKRHGFIHKVDGVSRGLGLVHRKERRREPETVSVPLLGAIAAGEPFPLPTAESWSDDSGLDTVDLPQSIAGSGEEMYALQVKGESMIDALIADGDIVVMEQADSVRNGQTAAVRIFPDDETTLKKFYNEGATIRLQPENSQMAPMHFPAENVEVLSRVVAVLRLRG